MNGSFFVKASGRSLTPNEAHEHKRQKQGAQVCRRPNYFCFAMPCAVYRNGPRIAIPAYAGVYTVDEEGRVFEERRPIQLHTERIAQEDLLALARKMHHRYWEELRRMRHAPGSTMPLVSVEQAVDDGAGNLTNDHLRTSSLLTMDDLGSRGHARRDGTLQLNHTAYPFRPGSMPAPSPRQGFPRGSADRCAGRGWGASSDRISPRWQPTTSAPSHSDDRSGVG
ncbi:MAG: hypothetical protein IPN38_04055 [Flavobacteriales bacterium]|nr:hypothetical protein [Flavobacteriales bacterium]